MLLYWNDSPGSNCGTESRKPRTQSVCVTEASSLIEAPLVMFSRWRTSRPRHRMRATGEAFSGKMSATRSSGESSPSPIRMPAQSPVTVLHSECVTCHTVRSNGTKLHAAITFPCRSTVRLCRFSPRSAAARSRNDCR